MTKQENRGGRRPNQTGRPKSPETSKNITFRANAADIDQAKEKHGKGLNQLFRDWLKVLH